MFTKRWVVSVVVIFLVMMSYGFLVFGVALEPFYQAFAADMQRRPEGEELMHWLAVGQLLMSGAFVWLWGQSVRESTLVDGLKFGFFMGLFWGGVEMILFAFMPMAFIVMAVGYLGDIGMMMLAGAALSVCWRKLS